MSERSGSRLMLQYLEPSPALELTCFCEHSRERVHAIRSEGLGLSPCWELSFMGKQRIASLAEAWTAQE